ncbi:MAG: hypothetical protein E7034_05510 [Akkermansiaceae bacterium]|nr:hypothetical protein [Akkermansiaceae bacterium]
MSWHSYAVPATITTARTMAGVTTEVTMGATTAVTMVTIMAITADNSPINHPAEALCNCGKFFLKKETVQRGETVV